VRSPWASTIQEQLYDAAVPLAATTFDVLLDLAHGVPRRVYANEHRLHLFSRLFLCASKNTDAR
jgi:hypothetical protein